VLIANRGEIAVRIIRACRELGIRTVAVYSDADRAALHVVHADEAWPCGPAPATQSYLNGAGLIEIARRAGADAIHPGYGFLSENAAFAAAVDAAGLVFIGPRADTIEAMGDKVISRRRMQAAGVPIVPGSTERLDDAAAAAFATSIGFPVMVKASAGGGGRGLRVVRDEAELAAALPRARSEAKTSFGDDGIYVEKLVEGPRHVEIQILGDAHGNVVHLFERECSVQRRHQKVIEEAPANGMTPELRAAMGRAAVAAAKAVDYRGAGTVEFLLDAHQRFYFLEMNTRVQVEHPITEWITGVDVVKTGIRIAAGEPIGFAQDDVAIRGWAIECRICAEDPDKGFLPSPGKIVGYRAPAGPGVRVDSGAQAGSEVTVHYDPLIAKLVCWGADRTEAIARMRRALAEFVIKGVKTSIPFHRRLLEHPDFVAGRYDTSLVERLGKPAPFADDRERDVALFVAAIVRGATELSLDKVSYRIAIESTGGALHRARLNDGPAVEVDLVRAPRSGWSARLDGRQYEVGIDERANGRLEVNVGARVFELAPK
jgi:acetyl-CoA carboxylase biotin carboxylase subunit